MSKALFLLILLAASAGCAIAPQPAPANIASLPIVDMGKATGGKQDYVLHVPKGQAFPIELVIGGDLLKGEVRQLASATLRRDIYLYKHWLSYDGKSWHPLRQLLGIGLAAGMDSKKAHIKVELSELVQ